MTELGPEAPCRDVAALVLVVQRSGRVENLADPSQPVRILDAAGEDVAVVSDYLREMVANGCSPASPRSYALALLRWWRFLAAVGVGWDRAGRAEVRDFVLWLKAPSSR